MTPCELCWLCWRLSTFTWILQVWGARDGATNRHATASSGGETIQTNKWNNLQSNFYLIKLYFDLNWFVWRMCFCHILSSHQIAFPTQAAALEPTDPAVRKLQETIESLEGAEPSWESSNWWPVIVTCWWVVMVVFVACLLLVVNCVVWVVHRCVCVCCYLWFVDCWVS